MTTVRLAACLRNTATFSRPTRSSSIADELADAQKDYISGQCGTIVSLIIMHVYNINIQILIIFRGRVVPKGLFKRSLLSFEAKKLNSEYEVLHTSYQ